MVYGRPGCTRAAGAPACSALRMPGAGLRSGPNDRGGGAHSSAPAGGYTGRVPSYMSVSISRNGRQSASTLTSEAENVSSAARSIRMTAVPRASPPWP